MNYIIHEEQFFDILGRLFQLRYKRIKYEEIDEVLYVYYGKSLTKYGKRPTLILSYYPNNGELWINGSVYYTLKREFPPVFKNLLFYNFFKKWFTEKFGISPKKVFITNEHSLNTEYNS